MVALRVGQDYSWCASIFYFGQLIVEFPVLYLLHKLPIRTFVAVSMLAWAVVAGTQAATKDFTGMMIARFFLGFTEGAVAPAFVVMVSFFYRKKEQPIRIAAFVSANAFAQIVGALLLYGCGSIKGARMEGWRISFLICGALTIVIGAIFFLVVPVSPATAWFLNKEEREVAVQRVAQEHASAAHSNFDWVQAKQTLLDPRLYIIFLWAFFVCITSVVTFGSIVVNGFGFSTFKTVLIGLPGPAIQLATIWLGAFALIFFPNARGWTQMALTLVPLIGVAMMKGLPYSQKVRPSSCHLPFLPADLPPPLASSVGSYGRVLVGDMQQFSLRCEYVFDRLKLQGPHSQIDGLDHLLHWIVSRPRRSPPLASAPR